MKNGCGTMFSRSIPFTVRLDSYRIQLKNPFTVVVEIALSEWADHRTVGENRSTADSLQSACCDRTPPSESSTTLCYGAPPAPHEMRRWEKTGLRQMPSCQPVVIAHHATTLQPHSVIRPSRLLNGCPGGRRSIYGRFHPASRL